MGKLAINGGEPIRTAPYPIWPVFGAEERENLLRVFESGKWWFGENVRNFAQAFADFQDAQYGVCCNSGTSALEIALLASGILPGDEVIVPAYTFVATASAVLRVHAIPVFADIDPVTCNIELTDIKHRITRRTRAVVPVHFAGLPVDMDALNALAEEHKLAVIEDACHSWGSQWKGKGTGALGRCGVFSFQMSKNITAGEGGIVTTDDKEIADLAYGYSNCGRKQGDPFYKHYIPGGNLRMTEFQAAILLAQLERLPEQTLQREDNAAILDQQLMDIPGVMLLRPDPRVTRRAYHMYIFHFRPEAWPGVTREVFLEALQEEGIPIGPGYPIPLYKNPLFQENWDAKRFGMQVFAPGRFYRDVSCPNTEQACQTACWIAQATLLGTPEDTQDIADAVYKLWENREELAERAIATD